MYGSMAKPYLRCYFRSNTYLIPPIHPHLLDPLDLPQLLE
jgi:hypothetical protein